MWQLLKRAMFGGEAQGPIQGQRPVRPLHRGQASDLIDQLPTIERVYDFYSGPDLRSALARCAWNAAADRLAVAGPDSAHWYFDALVACGRFEEVLSAAPAGEGKRWTVQASKNLAVRLHLGLPAAAPDVLALFGPRLTRFGRENLKAVTRYVAIQLAAEQREGSLIEKWAQDAHESPHGMSLFNGHMSYMVLKSLRGLHFDLSPSAEAHCVKLMRDAENAWREEQGIPLVGEGWVSETQLYYEIKSALEGSEVEQHARPNWLRPQHLDIYIPAMATAIEYQGAQHDQPVAFFGGEEAFRKCQERDRRKQRCCQRHGVRLIYVREGYSLEQVIEQVMSGKTKAS